MNCLDTRLNIFFDKLRSLFTEMDDKYAEAANFYEFHCRGCRNNCCESLFHHHTYLEFFYLKKGFGALSAQVRDNVLKRAQKVVQETRGIRGKNSRVRIMCPLNIDGLCILYRYRPMICRLHGIPSELKILSQNASCPGKKNISAGCETFYKQCGHKSYYPFDRAPFYMKMSQLEKELKETFAFHKKLKMTVAEILITAPDEL